MIFGRSFETVMVRSMFDRRFNRRMEADPAGVAAEVGLSEDDTRKLIDIVTGSISYRKTQLRHHPIVKRALDDLHGAAGGLSAWSTDELLDLSEAAEWWATSAELSRRIFHDKAVNRKMSVLFRTIGAAGPTGASVNETREQFVKLADGLLSELERRVAADACSAEFVEDGVARAEHLRQATAEPFPDPLT
ncbi:MAG: hypothetical protein ACR2H3_16945 [Acidimicrobiales bacterium]